ncbi:MAG: formyltransferase family protein [Mycobacteriaceae bacterium]
MIFIGGGSLLWRAVKYAVSSGYQVDLICIPENEKLPINFDHDLNLLYSKNVNYDCRKILTASSDNLVWSINNRTILLPELVETTLRIYNIHNGPLPQYRGLPEVAIVYALLNGDSSYGATLHQVDTGIDTGLICDTASFPIEPHHRFQQVMLNGINSCLTLFERNLSSAIENTLQQVQQSSNHRGGYFGRKEMKELSIHRNHPIFSPAPALGIFTPIYPELASTIAKPPSDEVQ